MFYKSGVHKTHEASLASLQTFCGTTVNIAATDLWVCKQFHWTNMCWILSKRIVSCVTVVSEYVILRNIKKSAKIMKKTKRNFLERWKTLKSNIFNEARTTVNH